jgi:hypothetical protein
MHAGWVEASVSVGLYTRRIQRAYMAMQADTTDMKSRMRVKMTVPVCPCVQGGSVGALLLGLIYAFQEKLVRLDSVVGFIVQAIGTLHHPS